MAQVEIPASCQNCETPCCRKGQVFHFGCDEKEALSFMQMNEENFQGRIDPEKGIVIQLTGDCKQLSGRECAIRGQSNYPGPCRDLDPDGGFCKLTPDSVYFPKPS